MAFYVLRSCLFISEQTTRKTKVIILHLTTLHYMSYFSMVLPFHADFLSLLLTSSPIERQIQKVHSLAGNVRVKDSKQSVRKWQTIKNEKIMLRLNFGLLLLWLLTQSRALWTQFILVKWLLSAKLTQKMHSEIIKNLADPRNFNWLPAAI